MNMTLNKRWCLTAILALSAVVYTSSSYAATDRLVIESGDSAQSRQQASMEKEQWNDTRSLRQKVNKRAEKEWDKADVAFDAQITARRAPTSMPIGSQTPCAVLTVAPAARSIPEPLPDHAGACGRRLSVIPFPF
ncbi:putative secreted protein [Klebsiella aerogenes]|nr:putative secreted protein [Klebsiella aerogenes]